MAHTGRWAITLSLIILPDAIDYQIGRYGHLRQRYLKEHRGGIYASMELYGKLLSHLAEVDQTCNERMDLFVSQMAQCEGVTEVLKASDQMEWVRRMNNVRNRAEEIVLREVVYT